MELKDINTINGYRIRFIDRTYPTADLEEIDLDNIVKTGNGFWARKLGEHYNLGTIAYYSPDGKNWVRAYIDRKSANSFSETRTQKGKFIYRACYEGKKVSIGKNVLTWYAANGEKEVIKGWEIDHINGDYTNDTLANLEKVSHSENIKRMRANLNRSKELVLCQ